VLASTLVGIVIGMPARAVGHAGVALLTTLTIKMPANDAILVLICTYVGAIYGGSRTAILLNIPGTRPMPPAACLDGYALARQGEAGRAMGIATSGSVRQHAVRRVCLAMFTPLLAEVALKFGAFEFFWLALFGVIDVGQLVGNDPLKGWLMGMLGLFLAQIGQDGLSMPTTASPSAGRTVRRHRADPGAGGRLRPGRGPDHAGRPGRAQDQPLKDSVLPRFRDMCSTGARSCARASSA
jgi:putative tricarboxylic transport membrane protein